MWRFLTMKNAIFDQLSMFAMELLHHIDEGESLPIDAICEHIDNGTIVEYICTQLGFKNLNVSFESVADVNDILKKKDVRENVAYEKGINNNGLVYLVHLIIEDFTNLLYDLQFNGIDADQYRR